MRLLQASAMFQSTRPVRGATSWILSTSCFFQFQSTRPVRGATLQKQVAEHISSVSIHAPRAGRDLSESESYLKAVRFQSTRPVRGATMAKRLSTFFNVFQSTRPVRGATLCYNACRRLGGEFQSTRPVRGATAKEVTTSLFCHIFMGITRHKYDFLDV